MSATPPPGHTQNDEARTATLAAANLHILRYVHDADGGQKEWEFLCECGRQDCHQRVDLTIDAYLALRDRGEAVLADGHRLSQVERAHRLCDEAEALRRQAAHQVKRATRNLEGEDRTLWFDRFDRAHVRRSPVSGRR